MKRVLLFLILMLSAYGAASAQSAFDIRGRIVDAATGEAVGFATVCAVRDSTVVAAVAADAEGRFTLRVKAQGEYSLNVSAVGCTPLSQRIAVDKPLTDAGDLSLTQDVTIDDVVLTIQKPLVVADAEKMTYSVEDDPQAATSTLDEIIRKVPQLSLDAEGNVLLNGKSDYKILVNGRTSTSMGTNFKEIIKSMPASQIKRIEVITSPSTKYDAEGAGGMLNLITNRERFEGYNGNVGAGVSYGAFLGLNGNARIALQKNKFAFSFNVYLNGNKNMDAMQQSMSSEYFDADYLHYLDDNSTADFLNRNYGASTEMSYQIDTLNLLTFEASYWGGKWRNSTQRTFFYRDASDVPSLCYDMNEVSQGPYNDISAGLNYQHTFAGNNEHTLTVSDAWSFNPGGCAHSRMRYENAFNYGEPYPQYDYGQEKASRSTLMENTLQIDYYNPVTKRHTVEGGLKHILRNSRQYNENSDIDRDGYDDGDMRYMQNILALYAGYAFSLDKLQARVGTRIEQTWNDAHVENNILTEAATDQTPAQYKREKYSYGNRMFNVVPYLSLTYMPAQGHSLSLSYTQRLRRPSVYELSPYETVSPNAVTTGNPHLKAAISHSISLRYGYYANKWSADLSTVAGFSGNSIESYSEVRQTADGASSYMYTSYSGEVNYQFYNATLSLSYRPSQVFNASLSASAGWGRYLLASKNIDTEDWRYDVSLNTTTRLWKGSSLTIGGMVQSGGAALGAKAGLAYYYYGQLSQSFLKESLQVSLVAVNPFNRYMKYNFEQHTSTYRTFASLRAPVRTFALRLTWRFGNYRVGVKSTNRSINNDDISRSSGSGGNAAPAGGIPSM